MSEKLLCAFTEPARSPNARINKRDFIEVGWVIFNTEKISEKSRQKQSHLTKTWIYGLMQENKECPT